jgi:hypothetical protein
MSEVTDGKAGLLIHARRTLISEEYVPQLQGSLLLKGAQYVSGFICLNIFYRYCVADSKPEVPLREAKIILLSHDRLCYVGV